MQTEYSMIEKTPAMEKILNAFASGYVKLDEYKDRLFWTEESRAVLGSIIGFISGLWLAGNRESANKHADEFIHVMDYVCPLHKAAFNIGSRDVAVPARVCELNCDGTMMGFRLAWYILLEDQQQPENGRACRKFGTWDAKYTYRMNGGLLFHGSTQDVYAVTLGSGMLWGIHT